MSRPEPDPSPERRGPAMDRREFTAALGFLGVAGGLFPGALWARMQDAGELTPEVVEEAEKLAGLEFSPAEREMMLAGLRGHRDAYAALREVEIPVDVPPALGFEVPGPPNAAAEVASSVRAGPVDRLPDPEDPTDLAFASLAQLGGLLREGSITSRELTGLYLERLRRFDPRLRCVVTLTEELAYEQAETADRELSEGRDRGPLHGIPWGAKDLLAVRGYPTTWGVEMYGTRELDTHASVVRRLEEAGAVLVAKLSLGELAMGDRWFGGRTRNPWNPEQGSSGSSAGPASATSAGLVGFSVGSETLGSIVSPSARCGVTGTRPTFGRVSRFGTMPLAWSMDKIGPICRTAEDCALVLGAIAGADPRDRSTRDVAFRWDGREGPGGLRVGVLEDAFRASDSTRASDRDALASLEAMDVELERVDLPTALPLDELRIVLEAEAATALDEITRGGLDDTLVGQTVSSWPNLLRTARFVPAVEYLRANRIRTLLIEALEAAWGEVDVVVAPTGSARVLLATNLTGHPVTVVPHGFTAEGTPASFSFVGRPWGDADALRLAHAFQAATTHHLRRPPGFS